MTESSGQKLIRIPSKDHYYYDSKSMIIYYFKNTGDFPIKFSTGIKYDEKPGCMLRATRLVTLKEAEIKEKKKKPLFKKLMSELFEDQILRKKKDGLSEGTLESYRTSHSHLRPYFDSYMPNEITDEEWLKFLDDFQKKNPGFSLFNVTKHFRELIKYLHDQGMLEKRPKIFNPNSMKEKIKRRKKRHRIYSTEEILLMDAVCNEDQRLVLWLGYDLGFRLDDCVSLEWSRVHLTKEPYIQFFGDDNKTGFYGKTPISDTCAELLRERRAKARGPWVFGLAGDPERPMLSQQIRFEDVVRNSGVKYGSQHILRHTRLTEDFGNPLLDNAMVMKIRRVSLAVALEHYIHPTESDLEKFRNTGSANRKGGSK